MITINRIIHPVGQGGFCTETFCDHVAQNAFTIVYDIGTFTASGKEYIRNWLKDNRVNVVVLSHLHNDHINCLSDLLEKDSDVKIIIPQMTNEEILEAIIYNGNVMIGNMEVDTFFNQKNLVTIKKTTQREYADFASLMNIEEVEGESQPALFQKDYFWKYFFYNPISKRDDLITAIKNSTTAISQIISNDKIDYVKLKEIFLDANLKSKLKELYGNIYKEHNSYSMCMYSGVDKGYKVSINSNCMKNHKSGCIYTGDIPLDSDEKIKSFCDYYKNEINDIGLIQIPHHGSKNNFNEKLLNIPNTDFFICSKEGFDNKCVVKTLEERKASFMKVTEKSEKKDYNIIVTQ